MVYGLVLGVEGVGSRACYIYGVECRGQGAESRDPGVEV